ncbi:hypothetical protein Acsp04_60850 [Actinomadura sp. NBRC 104425]|uniref:hypothetical protein n=1 Tax=Actinomadura sp. NBRC 104425 TaxID=3032204 RepID=UPI0024A525B8|nr:hypothetical protein [Actinomadura sp. NBRC 104425]GLZ15850.1 hypothetical protein Acsp04_60850 [Actinomadura sp. NBRC 104425]
MTTDTDQRLPRYRGLCGAIVRLKPIAVDEGYGLTRGFGWECDCGETGQHLRRADLNASLLLADARQAANQHASTCRALPDPIGE